MPTTNYQVPIQSGLLSHFPQRQLFVRDSGGAADEFDITELSLQARVRSGDYFASLATELDKLAQGLAVAQAPEAVDIERIVSELLYVHDNYRLTRK